MMKKIGFIILAILLVVVFWQFDFSGFLISIRQVSLLGFATLLMIQIITQLLVNYQWCRIGRIMGKDNNFFKMLYINFRGSIMESVTPGVKVGGEVTRALLLRNELNYSAQEAAALVTIQKIASFSSFLLINLFAFAHISSNIKSFQGITINVVVYAFLLALIGLIIGLFTFTSFFEEKIAVLKLKRKWTGVLRLYLLTLLSNINTIKSIKGEMYKQFVLSLCIWILFPIKMIILARMFTTNFHWVYLTEVTFISYMVGMVPFLPGGIGSFEATMTSLLIVMQITPEAALAITLLFRFITFWFVIILGFLYVGVWKMGGRKDAIFKAKTYT